MYVTALRHDYLATMNSFAIEFQTELVRSNYDIYAAIPRLLYEFVFSYALLVYSVIGICGLVSSVLLSASNKRSAYTVLSLIVVNCLVLIAIPMYLPFKALRFFGGLYCFAMAMSLLSRSLQGVSDYENDVASITRGEATSCGREKDTLAGEIITTFWFHIRPRLGSSGFATSEGISRYFTQAAAFARNAAHWLSTITSIDLLMYFIREWVPQNISPTNRPFSTALLVGIWVLFCMTWNYINCVISLDALGYPLPGHLRHTHPLLSTSLQEFWAARWNPLIGKLLQDTFYKPLARLGVKRGVCMVVCFVGSAALHALPQWLSTFSGLDSLMMLSFFVLHGLLVLMEFQTCRTFGFTKFISFQASDKNSLEFFAEYMTIATVLAIYLYCVEPAARSHELLAGIVSFLAATAVLVQQVHIKRNAKLQATGAGAYLLESLMIILGWVWTIAIISLTLPLFALPVFHTIDSMWTKSLLVGPLLRAIDKVL